MGCEVMVGPFLRGRLVFELCSLSPPQLTRGCEVFELKAIVSNGIDSLDQRRNEIQLIASESLKSLEEQLVKEEDRRAIFKVLR